MSNDRRPDKAKWQIPTIPHDKQRPRADFDNASDEVKAKFRELYPVSYHYELAEWFGIGNHSIRKIAKRLGLRKDLAAIARRRNKETGAFRPCSFSRMRQTDPERYKEIRRGITEKVRRLWERARREQLYGMKPTTRLSPSPLPRELAHYKSRVLSHYGYFADPDHPYWICYDSQTRRSAKVEENAKARGFEIVEGEG